MKIVGTGQDLNLRTHGLGLVVTYRLAAPVRRPNEEQIYD